MWAAPYQPSVRGGPSAYPGRMLTITQALVDQIVAHARKDHPDEACGVVAGPAGSLPIAGLLARELAQRGWLD